MPPLPTAAVLVAAMVRRAACATSVERARSPSRGRDGLASGAAAAAAAAAVGLVSEAAAAAEGGVTSHSSLRWSVISLGIFL